MVVVVRAENGPYLPVLHLGRAQGTTDAAGVATLLFQDAPDEQIDLQLDTSKQPLLRPVNPHLTFRIGQHDDVVPLDAKFTVLEEKKPPAPAAASRRARCIAREGLPLRESVPTASAIARSASLPLSSSGFEGLCPLRAPGGLPLARRVPSSLRARTRVPQPVRPLRRHRMMRKKRGIFRDFHAVRPPERRGGSGYHRTWALGGEAIG